MFNQFSVVNSPELQSFQFEFYNDVLRDNYAEELLKEVIAVSCLGESSFSVDQQSCHSMMCNCLYLVVSNLYCDTG